MPCIAKKKQSVRDFLEGLEIKHIGRGAFRYTWKRLDMCTWRLEIGARNWEPISIEMVYTYIRLEKIWRRKWQSTPVFLPGESQGKQGLMGCRLWGRTESDMTEAT